MSTWRPSECKYCQAKASDGVHISKRGMCPTCAVARVTGAWLAAKAGADQAVGITTPPGYTVDNR